MSKSKLFKKSRLEITVRKFILNCYKQAAGKKKKKIKWVKKKRNSVKPK